MNGLRYINQLIFVILLYTISGCDPVFVPDPIDPRLPKYTENGYNVAGAFVNDEVWKSKASGSFGWTAPPKNPEIIFYPDEDSLIIQFKGNSNICDNIEFRLSGLNVRTYDDLLSLHNTKIHLDGITNAAACFPYNYCSRDFDQHCPVDGVGQLYIKRIVENESQDGLILSGTFGFAFDDPNLGFVEVSYGRFDYIFRDDSL